MINNNCHCEFDDSHGCAVFTSAEFGEDVEFVVENAILCECECHWSN